MAETDIELKVGLNTKDVASRGRALRKEVSRIFDAQGAKELNSKTLTLNQRMSKLAQTSRETAKEIQKLKDAKIPTDTYKNAQKEVEKLKDELKTAQETYNEWTSSSNVNQNQLANLKKNIITPIEQSVAEAESKLKSLETSGEGFTPGSEANAEKIAALEGKMHDLNNQMAVSITKAYEYDDSLKNLGDDVPPVENKLQSIKDTLANIANAMKQGFSLNPFTLASNILTGIGNTFTNIGAQVSSFANNLRETYPILGSFTNALSGIPLAAGKVFGTAGAAVTKFGSVAKAALNGVLSKVKQIATWAGGRLADSFKGMTSRITGMFKKTEKASDGLKKGVITMIKAMIGIRGIYALFRKLTAAIKEGVNNLARYHNGNNSLNKSLSTLMSSLTQLKNALGAAFAPIVTAITPALNTLIQGCITAVNAIARLFAALGGSSKVLVAKKVQQDYATSLDKTGKSAKNTKKELDKLGDYDELKVIENNDDSGSDGSGGAGGLSPDSMFEEVEVGEGIQDLVDKLKEAWEKADFTEIGRIVGEKFKSILEFGEKWFDDVAKPFATKLGKCIGTFLNGFFETPGLGQQLGETIGAMINTALAFVNSFLDSTHFDSIGKFIGDALNGLTDKVDWEGIGHMFAQKYNAIFDIIGGIAEEWDASATGEAIGKAITKAIKDFKWKENASNLANMFNDLVDFLDGIITETDWHGLGEGIMTSIITFFDDIDYSKWTKTLTDAIAGLADFLVGLLDAVEWDKVPEEIIENVAEALKGIDWKKLSSKVGNLAGKLLSAVFDFTKALVEVFKGIGDDIIDYFAKEIEKAGWDDNKTLAENGEALIKGIFNGIIDFFKNIGTWIKENIFDPFVKGFKEKFEIHSPAKNTQITDLGKNLIAGVFSGVTEWMKDIKQWVKTNVLDKFASAFEKGSEIVVTVSGKVKDSFDKMKTKYDSIKDKVAELTAKAKDSLGTAYDNIKGAWNLVKSKTSTLTAKVKNSMGKAATKVSSIWSSIYTKTATLTATFKDLFSAAFKRVWNGLVRGVNAGINTINKIPGVNIPTLSYLAQGAVIPPNKEFMAVLGDQKQGVNIETPLDTMIEAFNTALANNQSGNNAPIVLQLNGKQIAQAVWDEGSKRYKQTGNARYAF